MKLSDRSTDAGEGGIIMRKKIIAALIAALFACEAAGFVPHAAHMTEEKL